MADLESIGGKLYSNGEELATIKTHYFNIGNLNLMDYVISSSIIDGTIDSISDVDIQVTQVSNSLTFSLVITGSVTGASELPNDSEVEIVINWAQLFMDEGFKDFTGNLVDGAVNVALDTDGVDSPYNGMNTVGYMENGAFNTGDYMVPSGTTPFTPTKIQLLGVIHVIGGV